MRGITSWRTLTLLPLLLAAGCERGPGADTLAEAGDFRLGIEEVADLLAPAWEIPADEGVVQAVADFWVDYSLLAWILNREDELDRLDLSPIVRQQIAQETVRRLRDAVIQVDTTMTDEELREIFEETRPADQVRARHILVMFPEGATDAQRDSLHELAESLRDRARAGEDFAQLAEAYSDDVGSAMMGGDLGYFGRGMMVPPFDSASFAMSPGEISDVIETNFGLHVIRLEDRVSPGMDELPYSYREQLQWEWIAEAEALFLDQVVASGNVQVPAGAATTMREVGTNPEARLSGAAASRAIAEFEGGSYTAADFREFVLMQPADLRFQIDMATDEQLEGFARDLVRDQLLLREAERRGIQLRSTEIQQLELAIKQEYVDVGEFLGLDRIAPMQGENLQAAIDREILAFLGRVVEGTQDLIPLGELAVPLRTAYSAQVRADAVPRAVARIQERREDLGLDGMMDTLAPTFDLDDLPVQPAPESPLPGGGEPPAEP